MITRAEGATELNGEGANTAPAAVINTDSPGRTQARFITIARRSDRLPVASRLRQRYIVRKWIDTIRPRHGELRVAPPPIGDHLIARLEPVNPLTDLLDHPATSPPNTWGGVMRVPCEPLA